MNDPIAELQDTGFPGIDKFADQVLDQIDFILETAKRSKGHQATAEGLSIAKEIIESALYRFATHGG